MTAALEQRAQRIYTLSKSLTQQATIETTVATLLVDIEACTSSSLRSMTDLIDLLSKERRTGILKKHLPGLKAELRNMVGTLQNTAFHGYDPKNMVNFTTADETRNAIKLLSICYELGIGVPKSKSVVRNLQKKLNHVTADVQAETNHIKGIDTRNREQQLLALKQNKANKKPEEVIPQVDKKDVQQKPADLTTDQERDAAEQEAAEKRFAALTEGRKYIRATPTGSTTTTYDLDDLPTAPKHPIIQAEPVTPQEGTDLGTIDWPTVPTSPSGQGKQNWAETDEDLQRRFDRLGEGKPPAKKAVKGKHTGSLYDSGQGASLWM